MATLCPGEGLRAVASCGSPRKAKSATCQLRQHVARPECDTGMQLACRQGSRHASFSDIADCATPRLPLHEGPLDLQGRNGGEGEGGLETRCTETRAG